MSEKTARCCLADVVAMAQRRPKTRMPNSFVWLGIAFAAAGATKLAFGGSVDWPTLGFIQVVTNTFSAPTSIAHAGDASQRIFVEEQKGRVWIIQSSNVPAQPFLDITNRVLNTGSEQGLLGLAFPPGYSTNAHFYVHYTLQPHAPPL